jgi:hypothetical protein
MCVLSLIIFFPEIWTSSKKADAIILEEWQFNETQQPLRHFQKHIIQKLIRKNEFWKKSVQWKSLNVITLGQR